MIGAESKDPEAACLAKAIQEVLSVLCPTSREGLPIANPDESKRLIGRVE
jgi:hypothetical protein